MARITVINDNPEFLDVMDAVLNALGHESTILIGGSVTVEDVADSRPDLVVIDLRLDSGLLNDGWGIVLGCRAHEQLADVPIVLCTADADFLRARAEEISALADVHPLPKPFGMQELEELIGKLLERFEKPPSEAADG
jgi:CheY-like chemotaxis protein